MFASLYDLHINDEALKQTSFRQNLRSTFDFMEEERVMVNQDKPFQTPRD